MSPMLAQGFELMLLGMGTVFAFLTLLVFVTSGMSSIVIRFWPVIPPVVVAQGPPDDEVAAISIAVAAHRAKNAQR